jgi:DNA-directed RNA polymerase subunit H
LPEFNILNHRIVPNHTVLSEERKQEILEQFGVSPGQLPKILLSDPAVKHIGAKVGDIVEIERISPTAGICHAYRYVIEG